MTNAHAASSLTWTPPKGLMFAFEGLDGAGKSTQIERLARKLQSEGCEVHLFRLNSNPVFKNVCRLLNQEDLITPPSAALMKAAELSGRYEYHIRSLLESGAVVLWDKYVAGSLAMDSARGVADSYLQALQASMPRPTLTLYLSITPEEALRRKRSLGGPRLMESGLDLQLGLSIRDTFELMQQGGIPPELIEKSFKAFQGRLGAAYEQYLHADTTVHFDATEHIETLSAKIWNAVSAAHAVVGS